MKKILKIIDQEPGSSETKLGWVRTIVMNHIGKEGIKNGKRSGS